jgi:6-bladed beta-propeller
MRKRSRLVLMVVLFVGSATLPIALVQEKQEKGGGDETGPYDLVANWPENYCGAGHVIGSTAGIWAERPDKVFIFARGCLPVLKPEGGGGGGGGNFIPSRNASGYDLSQKDPARHPRWDHIVNIVNREGKLIESWEQHNKLFVRPHRVLISPYDPERHIWLVDDGAHMVYKFTNDGKKLVMSLGEFKVPGNDEKHFGRPTDVAWLPDGTFFVSDGYTNTRVVKFDKNGKFLMTWGQRGNEPNETRPGYMNTVHAIVIDKNRRIYISDRANSRVQVFDENGKFLDAWPNMRRPYSLLLTEDQHLWAADGITQKFTKFDLNGKLLYSWGTFGAFPGGFWGVHQFHVDQENNLYTADVHVGRPQKFRPKQGADRAKLVGQPFGYGGRTSTSAAR